MFFKPLCWISFSYLQKHILMPYHQEVKFDLSSTWGKKGKEARKTKMKAWKVYSNRLHSEKNGCFFFSENRILLKIFHLSNMKQIMRYIKKKKLKHLLHQRDVYRPEHVKECSLATDSKERYRVRSWWKNTTQIKKNIQKVLKYNMN